MKGQEFRLGLALVPAVLLIPLVGLIFPRTVPNVLEGKPAPALTLKTLEGDMFSLRSQKGRPLILNFWATYCEPCKVEHPLFVQTAKDYEGRVDFAAIIYLDSVDAAREYLNVHPTPYPTLSDPEGKASVQYRVSGIPETVFINAEGVVLKKHVGPVSPHFMREMLDALLKPAQERAS